MVLDRVVMTPLASLQLIAIHVERV